jgi:hypothetical protein
MTVPAPSGDIWGAFSHDPRDPANGGLRASDRDREVVHQVLAEAYADGRLDRAELDLRTTSVEGSRTLGDLPPLVSDLVAVRGRAASVVPDDLHQRAVRAYEADRRQALLAVLVPSLICMVVWAATMFGGFFWPAFVIAGTGVNLLRTLVQRTDIVERHERRLAERQPPEGTPDDPS